MKSERASERQVAAETQRREEDYLVLETHRTGFAVKLVKLAENPASDANAQPWGAQLSKKLSQTAEAQVSNVSCFSS